MLRKVPDMLESFVEKAPGLLEDRSHSVLLAGVTLMLDICSQEPSAAEVYRTQVPLLCRVLRSLIMGGFAPGGCTLAACPPCLPPFLCLFLQPAPRLWAKPDT